MEMEYSQTTAGEKIVNSSIEIMRAFGSYPRCEIVDDDNSLSLFSEVPHPLVNNVIQAQLDQNGIRSEILTICAAFQKRGAPFMWYLWPNSTPEDLAEHLLAMGLTHSHESPAMLAELADLPETVPFVDELRLERVDSEQKLADYRVPLAVSFQLPEEVVDLFDSILQHLGLGEDGVIQNYVAYLADRPAACATVHLGKDGVAGVWNVATIPEARGKGLGTAVTWLGCHEAKQRGYQDAMLLSSEMGYNVYQRLGFKEIFKAQVYLWQPSER
jgi:ribosomal protein S18 acetylase RimI-like enzyme